MPPEEADRAYLWDMLSYARGVVRETDSPSKDSTQTVVDERWLPGDYAGSNSKRGTQYFFEYFGEFIDANLFQFVFGRDWFTQNAQENYKVFFYEPWSRFSV